MNKSRYGVMNTLVGTLLSLLLLVLTAGVSFYLGTMYGQSNSSTAAAASVAALAPEETVREVIVEKEVVVEKEVTVEVEVERIVEVEVTRLVTDADSAEMVSESEEEVAQAATPTAPPPLPTPLPSPTVVTGPPIEDLEVEDLDLFFEAWSIMEEEFYGPLPSVDQLNYALINAAIESLNDQFTTFAEPQLAEQLRESMSGTYEGIGAFVNERDDGFIEITRPIQGLPADLAGVKPGDLIVEVDGVNVVGQSINEVITLVRGPRDSIVVLSIAREGEEDLLQISITRARIEIPTVESELLDDNIGYISLSSFNGVATDQLTAAYNELAAENPRALILDLRNNPGGFLNVAIDVADLFLPESTILLQRNNRGLDNIYEADNGDAAEQIPLIVLVNEASASASELIAGAFQDNERAILIGVTTFGKGSVQHVHNLSDGSELRVTFSRYYTPDDNVVNEVGITPDIIVEFPDDGVYRSESDTQLNEAIQFILENY